MPICFQTYGLVLVLDQTVGEDPHDPDDQSSPERCPKGVDVNSVRNFTRQPKGEDVDEEEEKPEGKDGNRKRQEHEKWSDDGIHKSQYQSKDRRV